MLSNLTVNKLRPLIGVFLDLALTRYVVTKFYFYTDVRSFTNERLDCPRTVCSPWVELPSGSAMVGQSARSTSCKFTIQALLRGAEFRPAVSCLARIFVLLLFLYIIVVTFAVV
jgi:hypothetical protein